MRLRSVAVLAACGAALIAQEQQRPAGLETAYEMAPVLQELSAHGTRLLDALDKVNARAWVEKGASETYVQQLESSREQAKAVSSEAKTLARNPEQLAASLELLFRIQALDTMMQSLQEGIRKYQDPAQAQMLAQLAAEDGANRDRFQKYIVNLASDREHSLRVADEEAQRCRATLATPPPTVSRKKK